MKTRVLYIIPSLNMGGAEILLINHLNNIDSDKYIAELIIVGDKYDLLDQISNNNIKLHLINATKANYLFKILKIFKVVNKCTPDIIHSHLYKANILARLLKFCFPKIKVVNHYHGLSYWMTKSRLFIEKITQKFVDTAIVVSDKSFELRLKRENLSKYKLELVYNFIKNYPENLVHKKKSNCIVFGMACRLIKLKNIPNVIRLVKHLNDCGVSSQLKIAGSGPELDKIKEIIKETRSSSYISLLGFQSDLDNFYLDIDVYVVASDTEDLPLSILEAMGYGCPVISSNVGGISNIVNQGEGLIIDKIDKEFFRIIKLYLNDLDFESAFEVNRKLINDKFRLEKYMNRMDSIYTKILA